MPQLDYEEEPELKCQVCSRALADMQTFDAHIEEHSLTTTAQLTATSSSCLSFAKPEPVNSGGTWTRAFVHVPLTHKKTITKTIKKRIDPHSL
jgi:hypothetical protein